jgi:hypothetical protein
MNLKEEFILRKLIREFVVAHKSRSGSHPEEQYDEELLDDSSFKDSSVYVPDDIKKKIKKWAKDMGLSTGKK